MANRFGIRGKWVGLLFSLGGQRYDMVGVSNIKANSKQSIDAHSPTGQEEEETDLNHKGWEVEWETRETNGVSDEIADRIIARTQAKLERETVVVQITKAFGGGQTKTYAYSDGDLIVEVLSVSNGDDPVVVKYKVNCKRRQRMA